LPHGRNGLRQAVDVLLWLVPSHAKKRVVVWSRQSCLRIEEQRIDSVRSDDYLFRMTEGRQLRSDTLTHGQHAAALAHRPANHCSGVETRQRIPIMQMNEVVDGDDERCSEHRYYVMRGMEEIET